MANNSNSGIRTGAKIIAALILIAASVAGLIFSTEAKNQSGEANKLTGVTGAVRETVVTGVAGVTGATGEALVTGVTGAVRETVVPVVPGVTGVTGATGASLIEEQILSRPGHGRRSSVGIDSKGGLASLTGPARRGSHHAERRHVM
jgi:hypothetical protein